MRSRWIVAVILGIVPAASASAQQSHLDTRRQIEQLAATFSERYNKQDASAVASMFTKDAVRVTSGISGPSIGRGKFAIQQLCRRLSPIQSPLAWWLFRSSLAWRLMRSPLARRA